MKKLLSVFLCVMMVLLMSVTPAALAQEEELSKDVTINVYSWWDPTKVGMVNLKEGFEKKYADYNVKLNFVKISEYYKTMLTKLAGIRLAGGSSEAIDVMMIAFDKIPQFAANNTLMQLDAFASQEYLDSLYPSVREGLYFDGHLYATARDVTANCAILNTALFEKYNIELPAEDWTMDDFLALCKEVYEKTGYKTDLGYGTENFLPYVIRGLGRSLSVDGQLGVTAEDMAYFYGLYERGVKEGWLLGGDVFASLVAGSVEQNPMVYGSDPSNMSWCAFNWTNQMVAMQNAAPEGMTLGLTTLPSPDPVKSNYLACSMYFSISANTAEPDEAVKFLNYFVNSVAANKILLGERGIPVSSVVGDAIADDLDDVTKQVVAFVNNVVVPNSSPTPAADPDGASEIHAASRELVEQISYGAISAEDAAQMFIDTATEILNR